MLRKNLLGLGIFLGVLCLLNLFFHLRISLVGSLVLTVILSLLFGSKSFRRE